MKPKDQCTTREVSDLKPFATRPPLRILLADDEPLIRVLGRELLSNLGYEVEVAADEAEVLNACDSGRPPDVVLLDFHLPGGWGPELVRRLREQHPKLRVLVASGYFSPRDLGEIQEAGAHGYILKPFRLGELKSRLEEVLHDSTGP